MNCSFLKVTDWDQAAAACQSAHPGGRLARLYHDDDAAGLGRSFGLTQPVAIALRYASKSDDGDVFTGETGDHGGLVAFKLSSLRLSCASLTIVIVWRFPLSLQI